MTWTYTNTLLTDKDKVRFLTGDTLTGDQLVSDEEIAGILLMHSNVYGAGAAVCRHLATRFSRQADSAIDDMRKSLSQKATAYAARAEELDDQASSATGVTSIPMPFAGGISVSGKQARRENTDRVSPAFTRDDDFFRRQGASFSEDD